MQIVYVKVTDLKPYKHNPRKNDNAVDAVAKSIKEFGFKVPIIIDKDGEIVAGHTRLKAAVKLGLEDVPCIVADDLTPEQVRAFRLVDNKTAELSEWDMELLIGELEDLDLAEFNLDWGIDQDEIDAEEKADAADEQLAVDTLPDSRVIGFSVSAFGTKSECFVEVQLEPDKAERLLEYIQINGAEKVAELIKGAIDDAV